MKAKLFLIYFIFLNNISYAEFNPYMNVMDDYIIVLVKTYPSFDYVEYNTKFYEAIPKRGGIHSLAHEFKNRKEMYRYIDKHYKRSSREMNFFRDANFIAAQGLYDLAIVEDYREGY